MESSKFDNLVRGAANGASRRGVVRVGIGALAASALATMGLRSEDAGAKKKKKPVCNCTSSDPATCTTQKLGKGARNNLLNSNPCAYNGSCTAGVSGCPATCTGDRPVTCGDGCCPADFSKCCTDVENPVFTNTCNPTSYTCCPANAGGGSCPPDEPKCCPVTQQGPFGNCVEATDVCCTTATGGGACSAAFPVCCLIDPTDPDSGNCCPTGSKCCQVDDDCDGTDVCGSDDCCEAAAAPRSAERSGGRRSQRRGSKRFQMAAR